MPSQGCVTEQFTCFVDRIDGDVAYFTATSASGETFHGTCPASELKVKGINERCRFILRYVSDGPRLGRELEPIPDIEVSEADERAIDGGLRRLLGTVVRHAEGMLE